MINLINKAENHYNCIVFPVFEEDLNLNIPVSKESIDFIKEIVKAKKFNGESGEKLDVKVLEAELLLEIQLIGLGKRESSSNSEFRKKLFTVLKKIDAERVLICLNEKNMVREAVETAIFSSYEFDKYFSDKKDKIEKTIDILAEHQENFDEAKSLAEAVLITRDLVNEPANVVYPETLAKKAEELGAEYGFEVEVMEKEQIKELGMKAFLAVSQAAEADPRLIVLRYTGCDSGGKLGLIGKGLTYDTGGLSLKPSSSMETMKSDMGGAASVMGLMCAVAKNKLEKNIVAVIAACENSIGGNAYRPGDVIETMAGKTVEVVNTDAEGRLTLADAICYAIEKEGVEKVVDVATLTGAALVSLGTTVTAVISNSDEEFEKLEAASLNADERVWRLPNFPEYKELLRSKIADFKNTGGRYAGTITAAAFIEAFTNGLPWIHLDIAGTSWTNKPYSYYTYGATGQIVRTLYYFIKD